MCPIFQAIQIAPYAELVPVLTRVIEEATKYDLVFMDRINKMR